MPVCLTGRYCISYKFIALVARERNSASNTKIVSYSLAVFRWKYINIPTSNGCNERPMKVKKKLNQAKTEKQINAKHLNKLKTNKRKRKKSNNNGSSTLYLEHGKLVDLVEKRFLILLVLRV